MVAHTGALQRLDFSEESDERGFFLYDTSTGQAEWHSLPAWPLVTLSWEPEEVHAFIESSELPPEVARRVEGAIVRLRYRALPEEAQLLDQGLLARLLKGAGALHLAGLLPQVLSSERARTALDETVSAEEALGQWLGLRSELTSQRREQVLASWRRLASGREEETSETAQA